MTKDSESTKDMEEEAVRIVTINKESGEEEMLEYRMTELLEPRDKSVQIAFDVVWPKVLSIDNPLIGFLHKKSDISFNFILENGEQS